ncbi:hypothetical protein B7R54_17930 [Subtercola boreus]|uniref:3-oxoacyl-ACP reductase n=1 Tax=Subtercola boreus TaxID=120213 RepID=A0A3E0VN51_9MICO|nr:SDR family oxidoreductase [Subtercola boreus]RFA10878.1 hypothetical protein B7R54_17930 [Subtercola boreus]TQL55539.1 3-oxoacyl-[acyl-carrier protein] reductase/17beta-estradiol 17-dehydrogenase/3alpha(17beta)-hydroxysteroid dehydrogenase (NAD+) [Subtercola boreus]
MSIQNTVSAIVTGGAGGIGSVISTRLAELGYSVVVADADTAGAERRAAELPTPSEGQVHAAFGGDLTRADVNRGVARAAADIAPIGVLVNAVGISPKDNGAKRSFFDISEEEWDLTMAVNLKSPFLLVKEACQLMAHDGSASIVNLLSITSKLGAGGAADAPFGPHLPSSAAYAASKAALQNLTATLSRELIPQRIRVNGVAPGFVATPMMSSVPDEASRILATQIPLGRFGTASEVTDAIEFLISTKAGYITGTSLDVNGGWLTC